MAISNFTFSTILELYNRGIFDGKNSVIDMGDQDINLSFDEIEYYLNQTNVIFNLEDFKIAKDYPNRPRVPSSMLWKTLGFNKTDRIDILKLPRKDEVGKVIVHDLNYPLKKEHSHNYDLVTDFGNNEHPFNVVETFKTMHNLCSKDGYLLIYQSFFKGNGYYNFDKSFFESIAAVNNYSIVFSNMVFNNKKKFVTSSVDSDNLKLINLNNIDNIYLFYLLRKKNMDEFKYPYQSSGSAYPAKEYYKLSTINQKISPEKFYIPISANSLSLRNILKLIIKKIF